MSQNTHAGVRAHTHTHTFIFYLGTNFRLTEKNYKNSREISHIHTTHLAFPNDKKLHNYSTILKIRKLINFGIILVNKY